MTTQTKDTLSLILTIPFNNGIYWKDANATCDILRNNFNIPIKYLLTTFKFGDGGTKNSIDLELEPVELNDLKATINKIKSCKLFNITITIKA